MWAAKVSLSSMVTLKFLFEDEGVNVADPRVIKRSVKDGGFGRDVEKFRWSSTGGDA